MDFAFKGIYLCALFISLLSFAEEIGLFGEDGEPAANYRDITWALTHGAVDKNSEYLFPGGDRFKIINAREGWGGTTVISKVEPIKPRVKMPSVVALRIAVSAEASFTVPTLSIRAWIQFYQRTYPKMVAYGIPVPEVFLSVPGQFIAAEFIEKTFDFEEFLTKPQKIPKATLQKAQEALFIFARRAAAVSQFMDFKAVDLVYESSKDRWVLLDYTGLQTLGWRRNGRRDHPFGDAFAEAHFRVTNFFGETQGNRAPSPWETEVLDRIDAEIGRTRLKRAIFHPPRNCARILLPSSKFRLRAPVEIEDYLRRYGIESY